MSVHEEKSQEFENGEQIEFLQAELTRLSDQLKSQTDYAKRERLESLIGDIRHKIEMQQTAMIQPATSKEAELRKSSRERKFTPKMQELKQQESSQRESKLITLYESWKEQIRDTRTKLKDECSDQDLGDMMDTVEGLETQVRDAYENIRSKSAHSTEIRRKMDSCSAVTTDVMGLMKVRYT